jgi:hypothetical protein
MQPQLLEISDPGFYIVEDGNLLEVCDGDTERLDALRLLAVKIHLDNFTTPMTVDEYHRVTVNEHTKYQGTGPDEAMARCGHLRTALATASATFNAKPPDCVTRIPENPFPEALQDLDASGLKEVGYRALQDFLRVNNPESLTVGTHVVLNTLHFIITDEGALGETMREAWNMLPIKDRRTPYTTCDSEWLVLTDLEADAAWDESLENYIDECLELPPQLESYFDREAWKRDARTDGRGHSLSGYNGTEDSVFLKAEDESLYLYRTN